MALNRFQNLPAAEQQRILDVAAKTFAREGYDGCSYNALLERLGMGKSQAYYYFADKADLFLTALAAVYERYYERVAKLPLPSDARSFWSYVEVLTRRGFEYQAEDPTAARLSEVVATSELRFRASEAMLHPGGSSRQMHEEWLLLGQRLGAVRTDLPIELLVGLSLEQAAFVDSWFAMRAARTAPRERNHWARVFTDLSRRIFSPEGAPSARPTRPRRSEARTPTRARRAK